VLLWLLWLWGRPLVLLLVSLSVVLLLISLPLILPVRASSGALLV
jgi:hypothetical protein